MRDASLVSFGKEDIDLTAVEQIVEKSQVRAIAAALLYAKQHYIDGQRSLPQILDAVAIDIETHGLDVLSRFPENRLRRFSLYGTGSHPQPPANLEKFETSNLSRK